MTDELTSFDADTVWAVRTAAAGKFFAAANGDMDPDAVYGALLGVTPAGQADAEPTELRLLLGDLDELARFLARLWTAVPPSHAGRLRSKVEAEIRAMSRSHGRG